MMTEEQFMDYKKYREEEEAKAAKRKAEAEAARRKREEDAEREKAEEDAWMQRNRPDEWERLQREKENHRRALEERAKRQKAKDKWQAGWKSESVEAVVKEIVEASDDMNAFTARFYDCYDRPGLGIYHIWCKRLVDAYKREHGK